MRRTPLVLLVVCITGCATLVQDPLLDKRYGAPDPTRFDTPAVPSGGMSYRKDVQPILERRCVVCHGWYDAPCQIKLGAWEGIARGASTAWLPEVVFMRVDDPPRAAQWFTLLRDTANSNVSHVVFEKQELLPAENTLTVVPGFIGAYPNAVYRVRRADLPALTAAIRGLGSEDDYGKLADRFGVRRTDPAFWAASDAMNDAYAQSRTPDAGLLDLNRLENR